MWKLKLMLVAVGLAAWLSAPATVSAQGLFGSQNSGIGSTSRSSGSMSSGMSGLGGQQMGRSGGNMAGFGTQSGVGTQSGLGTSMMGGLSTQGSGQRQGLVGRTDTAGRFVGTTAQGGATGNQFGQQGNQGRASRGMNNLNNQSNFGQQGFGGNGSTARKPIQTQHRVAFTYAAPSASAVSQSLTTRIQKTPQLSAIRDVTVTLESGEVTLRGTVASEDQRRLAAQLARLEPGVRKVKNELAVSNEPATQPVP